MLTGSEYDAACSRSPETGWLPRAKMWVTPSCSSSSAIEASAAIIGTAENQNVPVTKKDPAASRSTSAPRTAATG